jgi:signal transduction histidine kinase
MDILAGLVEFMQARAKEKNISLTLKKADLPLINADGRSMEEVFSNLITNAINYTPEGGKITLEGEVTGDFVHIDISDTGYGIPADELPRIFERFYRVKTDKTRNIVGTGLGLPIVKSILDAHNGTIKAESKEGAGSTFSVRLPVR